MARNFVTALRDIIIRIFEETERNGYPWRRPTFTYPFRVRARHTLYSSSFRRRCPAWNRRTDQCHCVSRAKPAFQMKRNTCMYVHRHHVLVLQNWHFLASIWWLEMQSSGSRAGAGTIVSIDGTIVSSIESSNSSIRRRQKLSFLPSIFD